jgi:AmmeMemoRadiSam system protein A
MDQSGLVWRPRVLSGDRSGTDVLQAHEQDLLRRVALESIHAELSDSALEHEFPRSGPLSRPGSAFVTLKNGGKLRGCIGLIGRRIPLAECVRDAACRALKDSRFTPVTSDELPDLEIEISVLSEFTEIDDVEAVEVGRHGLMVSATGRSGLLLPQVATEHEWDRKSFLAHACMKAGLSYEDWRRPDLKIEVFEAEVF